MYRSDHEVNQMEEVTEIDHEVTKTDKVREVFFRVGIKTFPPTPY